MSSILVNTSTVRSWTLFCQSLLDDSDCKDHTGLACLRDLRDESMLDESLGGTMMFLRSLHLSKSLERPGLGVSIISRLAPAVLGATRRQLCTGDPQAYSDQNIDIVALALDAFT